ncbi:hypothetical protein M065_3853 [Bacteroides fragilis str. Korea 419]|nr:hypothetical protein M065_3853 [Bacteroides fragilis str. Korea 419]
MIVQVFNHFLVTTFSYTDYVFVNKSECTTFFFNNFYEFACRSFTQRTFLRSCVTFINITADSTSKLFHFVLILN